MPITIALAWSRPDLLVIATPLTIVVSWSLLCRPRSVPRVADRASNPTLREGDATRWLADVAADAGADLAVAAFVPHRYIQPRPRSGAVTRSRGGATTELSVDLRALHWGRHETEPVRVVIADRWGSFRWHDQLPGVQLTVLPVPGAFDANTASAPASGLVGVHRSSRPGEGSEFSGVRVFHTGDRMRQVNWPRSLRSGELHVNTRWADRDTHVALLVDATADLGLSEGVDGAPSSLDTTVRAAGAIAEHFTRHGDRVSLQVLTDNPHLAPTTVPPGTGTAHLRRVLEVLALIPPVGPTEYVQRTYNRPFALSGDVLAILLSPLVTSHVLDRAVALGRRGIAVAVLDTLPEHLSVGADPYVALSWRVRSLERDGEIQLARQAGVAVVAWRGPGSLDQFLRDVARRAAVPHLSRR